MEFIIQLLELANGDPNPAAGQYVKDYDPAAYGGRGELLSTPNKGDARHFPDMGAATQFLRQSAGVRSDWRPNRPLTAWTTMILPAEA